MNDTSCRVCASLRRALSLAVLALLQLLIAHEASAQPIPARMPEPRGDHTATLLPSGKLLIAGGNNVGGQVANTTLYDWVINTWTAAGILAVPRFLHTATLLADGRVLVIGGTNGTILGSTELFDPFTNTWSTAASMQMPRYAHTATLLPNGVVLVVGGIADGGLAAAAELYDPLANAWMQVPGPAVPRAAHTATLLPSGRVLIVGGRSQDMLLGAAELYDPATASWTAAATPATTRADHTATLLPDGNVLVIGGDFVPNPPLDVTAERYDPARNVWTIVSDSSNLVAAKLQALVLLPSGQVFVAGGYSRIASPSASQYTAATSKWSKSPPMPVAVWAHTANTLPNGRVLVAGGYNANDGYIRSVALYDPTMDSWSAQEGSSATPDLDTTFGAGGTYLYRDPGIGSTVNTRQVLPLRDGGVLALGGIQRLKFGSSATYNPSASFKLTNKGVLDQSFGQLGTLSTAFDRFTTALELGEGSLVLASEDILCSHPSCMFLDQGPTYHDVRYRHDGALDPGIADDPTPSHAGNAAILGDGTTVSLGVTYCRAAQITNGCGTGPLAQSRPNTFDAVVIDADGHANAALEQVFLAQMIRCSPSGTAVPGVAHIPIVEATGDDKVMFVFDGCMLKLNRDGTPNLAFGDAGLSQIDNAGLAVDRVLVRKDGGTLTFSRLEDGSSYRVVKRLPSGLADTGFGVNGVIAKMALPFTPVQGADWLNSVDIIPTPAQGAGSLEGVVNQTNSRGFPGLDSSDRILIAGRKADNPAITYLARFDAQLNPDASFGRTGTGLVEIGKRGPGVFTPYSIAFDVAGRILVGGQVTRPDIIQALTGAVQSEAVTRLKADTVATTVVEFYNAVLDHYFITWKPDEIAKLDAGTEIKGWTRTGSSFNAFTSPQAGTVPICRFYIPSGFGDSHFFGRDTAECNATAQKFPSFVLEDPSFMYLALPAAGVCPDNTEAVYRAFDNRADANHRYMTEQALRDAMVTRGWVAEGDGADRVVTCAPI